jgi:hypothetical protein
VREVARRSVLVHGGIAPVAVDTDVSTAMRAILRAVLLLSIAELLEYRPNPWHETISQQTRLSVQSDGRNTRPRDGNVSETVPREVPQIKAQKLL